MNVELTRRAVKDLNALEKGQPQLYTKILAKIKSLQDDQNEGKPLVGPLKGKRSLRVGEYRIVYELGKNLVTVLTVNHRRDVYR